MYDKQKEKTRYSQYPRFKRWENHTQKASYTFHLLLFVMFSYLQRNKKFV